MGFADAIARTWKFNVPLNAAALNKRGNCVAFSFGDGSLAMLEASDLAEEPKKMQAHHGVSLCLAPDADEHAFLSGGDDGQVLIIDPTQDVPTPVLQQKKWVDKVAGSVDGMRAFTIGKKLFLLDEEGKEVGGFDLPSPAGGLAFSPNGKRLAVGHYNGVSLYWTKSKDASEPEVLPWKGSHLDVMWSPDGKIILSSLQEGALHGWQVADKKEMHMSGYVAKIRSMRFTSDAKFLATSGADQVVCWPFTQGGPWNKTPLMLGGSDGSLVAHVAPHPTDEVVAAGYDNGMVILAPLDGRMEVVILPSIAPKGSGVVGMEWSADGNALFAGFEDGTVHMFTQKSVLRAVSYR